MSPTTLTETNDGLAPAHVQASASIRVLDQTQYQDRIPAWSEFMLANGRPLLSHHPQWLSILERGLGHRPYVIEATVGEATQGLLPLVLVKSVLFGRFLVGLPYLNHGGVVCSDHETTQRLIQRAIELADQLKVRHLELRHEAPVHHPRMQENPGMKVHMRRDLPETAVKLWGQLGTKVRNQVRKGEKNALEVVWGKDDLLDDYYEVFSRNMRNLGTPVFGRKLFQTTLSSFPDRSELCVVRMNQTPIAAGLLMHGWGISEIPSTALSANITGHAPTCSCTGTSWFGRSSVGRRRSILEGRLRAVPPTSSRNNGEPSRWPLIGAITFARAIVPTCVLTAPGINDSSQSGRATPRRLDQLVGPYIVRGIP